MSREHESIFRIDDVGLLHAYTTRPGIARRLIKKGAKPSRIEKKGNKPTGWFFVLPGWVVFPRRRFNRTKKATSKGFEGKKNELEASP